MAAPSPPRPPGSVRPAAVTARRLAWFDGGFVDTPVYDRTRLGTRDRFDGPALVEDAGSTLVLGPGARCEVTATGAILVEVAG